MPRQALVNKPNQHEDKAMARIASSKTLRNSTKTRRQYAYNAIERATLERHGAEQEEADKAMTRLFNRTMKKDEMLHWAIDEVDYRQNHNY